MPSSKKVMVINRIKKRAKELGFDNLDEYVKYAIKDENLRENIKIVSLLTTGKTVFFREIEHFNILTANILPSLFAKKKFINVWSIGSSTGQEPYSLAMVIDMYITNSNKKNTHFFSVLATDVDIDALDKAREGIYREDELVNLPNNIKERYFILEEAGREKTYRIRSFLKEKVYFAFDNIIDSKINEVFDIVFLKNTLMYFTPENREKALDKVYDSLENGGYLFIGITETIDDIKHCFKKTGFIKVYTKF